jgi:hypothetical protein
MNYRGHVKNGVVLLDEPAQLPEGAAVCVELAEETKAPTPHGRSVREFAGMLADLSESEWAAYQRAVRRRPLFES